MKTPKHLLFNCYRCGIPVVIMGETGCGKTRLIRYMCQLQTVLKTTMRGLEENEREPEERRQTFFVLKVRTCNTASIT